MADWAVVVFGAIFVASLVQQARGRGAVPTRTDELDDEVEKHW